MSVLIIRLDPGDTEGSTTRCEVEAPFDLPDAVDPCFLHLNDLTHVNGPDMVRRLGEMLSAKLMENPRVAAALAQALSMPPTSPTSLPICFHAPDQTAHGLSLEALVGAGKFLGLDARWPIARISRKSRMQQGTVRIPYSLPLNLVCVLSAVGLSAAGEWEAIYAAVLAARADGLPIRVTLLVGEEALVEAAQGLGDPDLTVKTVPEGATDLLDRIKAAEPDLVHLFCHGTIVNQIRRLEIGHVRNHDPNNTESPVFVQPERLGLAAAAAGAWAVILNTCRGADASEVGVTHVEEILNAGVPIGIGMRRQVQQADAEAFSEALYPEIFRAITAAAATPPHHVSWPDTLVRARCSLVDRNGADAALNDAWTLPVLYTGFGPFELAPIAPGADLSSARQGEDGVQTMEAFHHVMLRADAPGAVLDDSAALAPPGS